MKVRFNSENHLLVLEAETMKDAFELGRLCGGRWAQLRGGDGQSTVEWEEDSLMAYVHTSEQD